MKLKDPANAPPFTRAEGILHPVTRLVSPMPVHPKMAVPGITPGVWLLWRLRRPTGYRRGTRL